MSKSKQQLQQEIFQTLHGIQTGIKFKYETEEKNLPIDHKLKHIRVGVDNAIAHGEALSMLLVKKGVFTEEEFLEQYLDSLQFKLKQYKRELSEELGVNVNLI